MSKNTVTRSTFVSASSSGGGYSITKSKTSSVPSKVPLIFGFIFLSLLVIAVIKTASGSEPVTFTSLLEFLSSFKRVFVDFSITDYTITADWGIINGLRNLLNIFTGLFGIIVFTGKSIVNTLVFVFQFVFFIL